MLIKCRISPVVKGGCDNGWSEDQFERDCEPVSDQLLIKMMIVMTVDG